METKLAGENVHHNAHEACVLFACGENTLVRLSSMLVISVVLGLQLEREPVQDVYENELLVSR